MKKPEWTTEDEHGGTSIPDDIADEIYMDKLDDWADWAESEIKRQGEEAEMMAKALEANLAMHVEQVFINGEDDDAKVSKMLDDSRKALAAYKERKKP